MRAYKVFLIVKVGRNTDHCGLFIETDLDHKGTIVQVTGGGRAGMRLQRQTEAALDATWDDNRKDHIGWVMENKFAKVWSVVRMVPPPGRTDAKCRTARGWTDLVTRALQSQGVMENSRESEATVHEAAWTDEIVEEEEGERQEREEEEDARRRARWDTPAMDESDVSEEE